MFLYLSQLWWIIYTQEFLTSSYCSWDISVPRQMLQVHRAVSISRDLKATGNFSSFEFIGIAVVSETSLTLVTLALYESDTTVILPGVISLFSMTQLFFFNTYGIFPLKNIVRNKHFKARENVDEMQEIKALFRQDVTAFFAILFGPYKTAFVLNVYFSRLLTHLSMR